MELVTRIMLLKCYHYVNRMARGRDSPPDALRMFWRKRVFENRSLIKKEKFLGAAFFQKCGVF